MPAIAPPCYSLYIFVVRPAKRGNIYGRLVAKTIGGKNRHIIDIDLLNPKPYTLRIDQGTKAFS